MGARSGRTSLWRRIVTSWRWERELRRTASRLAQLFGERDAQLLLAVAAIRRCWLVCAVDHLRAADLAHFARTGEPSPLGDATLVGDDARARLAELCRCEQLATAAALIERQTELGDGRAHPQDERDELLCAALAAYEARG